jgi:hypothetical protein
LIKEEKSSENEKVQPSGKVVKKEAEKGEAEEN